MEKLIREYGVIILLYLVISSSFLVLNEWLNYLNKLAINEYFNCQRGFTN